MKKMKFLKKNLGREFTYFRACVVNAGTLTQTRTIASIWMLLSHPTHHPVELTANLYSGQCMLAGCF